MCNPFYRWREDNRWRAAESLRNAQLRVESALETRDGRQRVAELLTSLGLGLGTGGRAEGGGTAEPCAADSCAALAALPKRNAPPSHKGAGAGGGVGGRAFPLVKISALISSRHISGPTQATSVASSDEKLPPKSVAAAAAAAAAAASARSQSVAYHGCHSAAANNGRGWNGSALAPEGANAGAASSHGQSHYASVAESLTARSKQCSVSYRRGVVVVGTRC